MSRRVRPREAMQSCSCSRRIRLAVGQKSSISSVWRPVIELFRRTRADRFPAFSMANSTSWDRRKPITGLSHAQMLETHAYLLTRDMDMSSAMTLSSVRV